MWIIHAKLPLEQGSLVTKAIDKILRRNQDPKNQPIKEPNSDKNVSAETSESVEKATFAQQRADASLITVLKDEQGKVLNIGRNSPIISANIRRALDIRDETCRYPGCTCNQYVDFHHIKHWADGGETKLDNLVKLCRYHHRELHKGHFNIEIQQPGALKEMVFKTASGAVIPDNPKLPDCELSDFIAGQNPEIDCHTGDSQWSGETMDYGMGGWTALLPTELK